MVASLLFSSYVYAEEADNEKQISIPDSFTMIEYDYETGEEKEVTYQTDTSLTDTSQFLSPVEPYSIIGDDEREPLDFPDSLPLSAIGKIYITGANGKHYVGTGFLVSDDLVLTAGHCLKNSEMGGNATGFEFKSGLYPNGAYRGSANAYRSYIPSQWENGYNSDWDWGLLRLDSPLGSSIGYLNCTTGPSTPTGRQCEIMGYPEDWVTGQYQGTTQVVGFGTIMASSQYKIFYDADTTGGMSGAPIFISNTPNMSVSGIHTNGTGLTQPFNSGVRITSAILTVISQKI